ncbi:NahK/ErcS family hybrid sensor histidine kinase/response regulator [Terasakiella sp. A23]|uniref:NahK/ErcS family hybrid sensor histidine kinase/response regulator n=1 Tax=Terasakiella sp. FCG-A23 TaxID=3080561 RepID=UPI002952AD75|nr:NahK/ErcS family hybrid sensor histidine kinase/response regulator [Terasakiella sp. A23]MDV7340236.1 NahK/ErcS family hybrid sensor histidine kinase/response regulator [Terasakiella sp. A23]
MTLRLIICVCLLAFLAVLTPVNAQTYEPGPYESEKEQEITNPRADFWRQVRDGMPGRVNIPDKDKGVLIRQGGNDWLATRSNVVANYGRQIIAVGLLLTLVFLFFTGRIKVLSGPVGWVLDKLVPLQKPAHWTAAVCFVLLGTTGLNILYGKRVLGPMMGREFFSDFSLLGKAIHNQASWIFMASIAIVMILKAREYLPGFVRERVSRKTAMDRTRTTKSEKVLFWFAVMGTLIVAYSGATLLIPHDGNDLRQMQLFQLMHSFSALTLTGLIVGNVYLISVGIRQNARQLLEAKEVLEEEVQQRTKELQIEIEERRQIEAALKIAKDVAEQANLSKDKFLATASHDLLQPLTAARLMIATLRMRELKMDNHKIVEQVHQSLRGTENLLTDLLDISRLGASTTEPKVTDFPLQQLLSAIETEFRTVARKNGLKFRLHCPNFFAKSDYQLLSRVIRNFLSNAIRYTDSGGVMLSARKRGRSIRIEVWDTGPGIPPEELQRIFEEFHRLEGQKRVKPTEDGGAGLGLAIVDRIAYILDHPVEVRSIEGKGSVFSIDVPIGTEISRLPQTQKLAVSDLGGVVVAIVDNDESVLMALQTYLQEWGCSVLVGTSGDDLIEQLSWSSFSPDLIMADYHLDAGLIGPEVVERVRRIYGHDLPAIVISADHTEEMRKSLKEEGYHFLSKPVRPAKMRALMAHLVNQDDHFSKGVRQSIGA